MFRQRVVSILLLRSKYCNSTREFFPKWLMYWSKIGIGLDIFIRFKTLEFRVTEPDKRFHPIRSPETDDNRTNETNDFKNFISKLNIQFASGSEWILWDRRWIIKGAGNDVGISKTWLCWSYHLKLPLEVMVIVLFYIKLYNILYNISLAFLCC